MKWYCSINLETINKKLGLQHNILQKKEEKIYSFNEKWRYIENIDTLKALGLAFTALISS